MGKGRPTMSDFRGEGAGEYHGAKWMRRAQEATTRRVLELLEDPRLGEWDASSGGSSAPMVLDVGCGSGFSTRVCSDWGLRPVGVDISRDMLLWATGEGLDIVEADLRALPIRDAVFPRVVSISTLNFVAEPLQAKGEVAGAYTEAFTEISRVTRERGRCVVEYYPKDEDELEASTRAARSAGFSGFLVRDNPGTRKEQKFLLLERTGEARR
ncbi:MAG: class I SAM-dependent methyltransferase [Promethearchaeota archaeon]